jgi:hypothetical protein
VREQAEAVARAAGCLIGAGQEEGQPSRGGASLSLSADLNLNERKYEYKYSCY